MEINFIPVNETNIQKARRLRIAKEQHGMVETVDECYAEARQTRVWRPVILEADGQWIGFAMYGLWEDEGESGRVWLDRFFIDERYQGKGFAKRILPILIRHITEQYACKVIYLSVYSNNEPAIHLYKKLGFRWNGETDIHGEKVMKLYISKIR